MIHCTYAWTSSPCNSRQIQKALIRIVCMAPGTTRYESVLGLYRKDTPSPTCNGSCRPRRVCTTNAFGGTTTVFHRPNPVTRTSTALDTGGGGGTSSARARLVIRPGAGAAAIGGGGGNAPAAAGDGAALDRRSCSNWACWATTWSR